MSWSIGYDSNWKRDIGYGVPAKCDHPGCEKKIDRGLGYVCCDQQPYGGDEGCGLYFCDAHMREKCERCAAGKLPFEATPDDPEWIAFKLTDESWEQWRAENEDEVKRMRAALDDTGEPKQ